MSLCFHSQVSANGADHSHNSASEMSVEEVAMGFIRVANEAMCRPIRALTQVFWVLKSQLQLVEIVTLDVFFLHLKSCFLFFLPLSCLCRSLTLPPPPHAPVG